VNYKNTLYWSVHNKLNSFITSSKKCLKRFPWHKVYVFKIFAVSWKIICIYQRLDKNSMLIQSWDHYPSVQPYCKVGLQYFQKYKVSQAHKHSKVAWNMSTQSKVHRLTDFPKVWWTFGMKVTIDRAIKDGSPVDSGHHFRWRKQADMVCRHQRSSGWTFSGWG